MTSDGVLHLFLTRLLILVVVVCPCCIHALYGIVINTTDQTLILEQSGQRIDYPSKQYHEQVVLKPHQGKRVLVPNILSAEFDLQGRDEHGTVLFARHFTMYGLMRYFKPATGDLELTPFGWDATLAFLVTASGVYPIPKEYRKTWQDHLDEIVSENPGRF